MEGCSFQTDRKTDTIAVDAVAAMRTPEDDSAWEYDTAPHIAPTAWFVMVINDFNPYYFNQ